MHIYDTSFSKMEEVKNLTASCPITIDFEGASESVRDIYFESLEHMDAMVGYASWYVRKKCPNVYHGAFLSDDFWAKLVRLEAQAQDQKDLKLLRKTREISEFTKKLENIMFDRAFN